MWMPLKKEHVALGVIVRHVGITDTPFNGGVIVAIEGDEVTLARPYAHASRLVENAAVIHLRAEVYSIILSEDIGLRFEVYICRNGKPSGCMF